MNTFREDEDRVIDQAIDILGRRMKRDGLKINAVEDAKRWFRLKLAEKQHEIFAVLFLNVKHCVIDYAELFRGTIDNAAVYPREIAKEALARNAAALILGHNHPSGNSSPSGNDKELTERISQAMSLLDIRVLDHIVVGETAVSMQEQHLL